MFYNIQAEKQMLWRTMTSYLKEEFKVPMGDPLYYLRLTNSMQLAIEVIRLISSNVFKAVFNLLLQYMQRLTVSSSKPEITLDYLTYFAADCPHYDVSEVFIVTWDSKTRRQTFWSRRSLLPLQMHDVYYLQHLYP